MAVLLSLHKSIFTLLARNRPVYCKVRYERGADVAVLLARIKKKTPSFEGVFFKYSITN